MFSQVTNKTIFDGCISGPKDCTCSQDFACQTNSENLLNIVSNVEKVNDNDNHNFLATLCVTTKVISLKRRKGQGLIYKA